MMGSFFTGMMSGSRPPVRGLKAAEAADVDVAVELLLDRREVLLLQDLVHLAVHLGFRLSAVLGQVLLASSSEIWMVP